MATKKLIAGFLLAVLPGLLLLGVWRAVAPDRRGEEVRIAAESKPAPIVRTPAAAGRFYPADASRLASLMDYFLAEAKPPRGERPFLLISPHAGYEFSGAVAAEAYNAAKGGGRGSRQFDTVIVIGPSHYLPFKGVSVFEGDEYETPIGRVKIDKELNRELMGFSPTIRPVAGAEDREHSVETQVPWLQRTLGDFKFVSLIVGDQSPATADILGRALAAVVEDKKVLIVASVDLSHYYPYEQAVALDKITADAVAGLDDKGLFRAVDEKATELDAPAVVAAGLIAAKRLGAERGEVLKTANSGDASGDKRKVVGYMSAAVYKTKRSSFTAKQRRELLKLARQAIATYLASGKRSALKPKDAALSRPGAAFVTINKDGRLRGCIGFTRATGPLYSTVMSAAVSAAVRDSRFTPLTQNELDDVKLEISVLSEPQPVGDTKEIAIGRDGLILTKGQNSGLFLPQVPVAQGWDTTAYLEQLGLKAGLDSQAWKSGARLERFEAEVFGE